MNKAAIASLLVFAVAPGLVSSHSGAFAQAPAGQPQITMDAAEQADYDNAMNKITAPAQQAPALEAYLAKYPKSGVKNYVLLKIMFDYSQVDPAKAMAAADNVIAATPNVLQAYIIEVALRKGQAEDPKTDAATKQSLLDAAVPYAQKGLPIAQGPKPDDVPADQWSQLSSLAVTTFYSTIGEDDLGKKDGAGAVTAYKAELAAMKPDQLATPAALQETFLLAQAYYASTPPDYVNCTFYATRAAALAPDQFKPQLQPLATYCYKKYHGGTDGYDAVVTSAKANVNPPADFKIVPAPTNEDIIKQAFASTPDPAALAIDDKEFIIQNGTTDDADKVFNAVKGKSSQFPQVIVVAATADQLQVSISSDAIQNKTADFTFSMKTPLKTVPAVGDKVDLTGTYASYTQKPLMITMSDGEKVEKPAPKKTTPTRRAPARH
jgi:hypothetical protein